jgi:DNA modification methylase
MKLNELKPLEKNPFKSKGDKQIEKIGKSIKDFERMMSIRKIVIDENNEILGGNKRFFALKKLGYTEISDDWIEKVTDLTEEQKKEFIVKDNAHWGSEWDFDMLKDWNIDLEDFGIKFEDLEIETEETELEEVEPEDVNEVKTEIQEGDLFKIGNHRLMCGDILKYDKQLMNDKKAQMCFTDPPWNVNYGQNPPSWKKRKKIENDNLGANFEEILKDWFTIYKNNMVKGASVYIVMSPPEWGSLMNVLKDLDYHWSSTIIWVKDSLVLSRKDYHTQYEPLWYGWLEDGRINPLKDRCQSDVWQIPRPKRSEEHPTMKPIELCARAIINSSKEGDLLIDYFGGSGSTMVACEQLNRVCYMSEIDESYCQVIINRMIKLNPDLEVKCLNRDFNPLEVNGF